MSGAEAYPWVDAPVPDEPPELCLAPIAEEIVDPENAGDVPRGTLVEIPPDWRTAWPEWPSMTADQQRAADRYWYTRLSPDERRRMVAAGPEARDSLVGSVRALGFASPAEYLETIVPGAAIHSGGAAGTFLEPEDRGQAVLSALGDVEYVEDLIRPGRIVVWAAEEGAGKSYTADGELGIRVAVAGGALAGTWPILRHGPVLVLSEMHADDDYAREASILEALELERSALSSCYYRLPLMTAAGGPPVLTVAAWRDWLTTWLRDRGALLLIVDTATGATQVDPWGQAIQAVYRDLRAMLEAYPELAIVLVLHLKKPQGRGDRRISDVLGEWGRWCDVIVLQEADGTTRTKLATYKRVRRQRRIVATRADGLLVDPIDLDTATGAKVKPDAVLAAIVASPGLTYEALGEALGVSKRTAARYVKELGEAVDIASGTARSGPRAAAMIFPVASSRQVASGTGDAIDVATVEASPGRSRHRDTTPIGGVADVTRSDAGSVTITCRDYSAHHAEHVVRDGRARCLACDPDPVEAVPWL